MSFAIFVRCRNVVTFGGVKKLESRSNRRHENVPETENRRKKSEALGINENDKHEKVYIHDNLTLISLLLRERELFIVNIKCNGLIIPKYSLRRVRHRRGRRKVVCRYEL